MRSPFAYTPRPGPLQAASPGSAVAYLGALAAVAFIFSSPLVLAAAGAAAALAGLLAGARDAVRAALRMGVTLGLLIVVVNALVVSRGETVPLPDTIPDAVAAALGTPGIAAYLALTRRAQLKGGETVLILAASGVLGSCAVQVARLLGAGRIVAGARDEEQLARARELGADAIVDLKQTDGLSDRIREASGGQLNVVIDPGWGVPGVAALEAMSPFGRSVQLGQAAGPEAVVKSGILRGRYLSILGFTNFLVPWEEQADAYRTLVDWATSGKLKVEFEVLPLEAAPDAWKRQAGSPHRKLALSPQARG